MGQGSTFEMSSGSISIAIRIAEDSASCCGVNLAGAWPGRLLAWLKAWFLAGAMSATAVGWGQAAAKPAAAARDVKGIVAAARARVEQTDVRASGRLVAIAGNGTRTTSRLVLESHAFPDGLRTLVMVTLPDHSVDRYWVTSDAAGHTTIAASKAGAAPARLATEKWDEAVAGTLFYPEDFADGQFFWARQALMAPRKYGARECDVLRSEPGPGQPSVYRWVTTLMDEKTGAVVEVEAAGKDGEVTKQFVFYGIERIGGLWLSRQIEAKENGKPGSSLLIVDSGSPHAHLTRKDFDEVVTKGSGAAKQGSGR
jgi:hypothetical protein